MSSAPAPLFYQDLVENTSTLVFEADAEGHFLYLNPAWELLVGYTREEMLGHSYQEFQPTFPHPGQNSREVAAELAAGKTGYFETAYHHKNGSIVHVAFQVKACLGPEGAILKYQGMGHDITQRVRAELALTASEELYRIHVENSFDVIFTLDLQGNFLYVSPAWEKHFGYASAQVMGKPFAPFVHPDDIPLLVQYLERCLGSDTSLTSPEYRVKHADGHWVWFIANGTPYRDNHGKLQYVGVAHDVTTEKSANETIAEKNREMERLTYVATHDLRAPLLNIDGFSSMLRDQLQELRQRLVPVDLPPLERAALDAMLLEEIPASLLFIETAADKMEHLLQGLLQVVRSGRQEMQVRRIDMDALIHNVLDCYQFQLRQASASVQVDVLPPCYGDENQLNQLFSNLLGNAIKYRDPVRPLRLHISAIPENYRIRYSLQDNGIGMSAQYLERVWDVFYRIDKDTSTGGDGLGLSIVRHITNQHHGRAWCQSTPGEGSVFHIELSSTVFQP